MDMYKLSEKAIDGVIKGKNPEGAVKELRLFAEVNVWPNSYNKNVIHDTIKMLIKNKIPKDSGQELIDLLLNQTRTLPKIPRDRIILLKEIDSIIRGAKTVKCEHVIEIGVFMHGGGFCMPMGLPELICNKCGLNVTIGTRNLKKLKEKGLRISEKNLEKLLEWAKKCFIDKNIRVHIAEDITENPLEALKNSAKWPHKLPFKIINMDKFEAVSGK